MTTATPQPEPWLRGTHSELPAVLRAVLHAFELAQEDVHHWTSDLSEADLHATPFGLTPIAFHLRHIPRSLDRLLTYAEGNQLSVEQIAALKSESEPGVTREDLFAEFDRGLESAAQRVRAFTGANLDQPRGVGKKQLPTSARIRHPPDVRDRAGHPARIQRVYATELEFRQKCSSSRPWLR